MMTLDQVMQTYECKRALCVTVTDRNNNEIIDIKPFMQKHVKKCNIFNGLLIEVILDLNYGTYMTERRS